MSESINDTSFRGVVRRHLHSHSIADRKPNEPLAHLSGNVREHEMIVRQGDPKHGPGQDHHDGALQFDRLFRIHNYSLLMADCSLRPHHRGLLIFNV